MSATTTRRGGSQAGQLRRWLLAVTPMVLGLAVAAADPLGALPQTVQVGQQVQFLVTGQRQPGTYELLLGPDNLKIDGEGVAQWQPTAAQLGPVRIKVRAVVGGATFFPRLGTTVTEAGGNSPQPAAPRDARPTTGAAAPGEPTLLAWAKDEEVWGYRLRLHLAPDGSRILVHRPDALEALELDGEGLKIVRRVKLPRRGIPVMGMYSQLLPRKDYDVGVNWHEGVLFLLGHQGETIREIPLPPQMLGRELCLHPCLPRSYLGVRLGSYAFTLGEYPSAQLLYSTVIGTFNGLDDFAVLEVDETTGEVAVLPNVAGEGLVITPDGKYLLTSLPKDALRRALIPDFTSDPLWPVGQSVLLAYDLTTPMPTLVSYNSAYGAAGDKTAALPDGRQVIWMGNRGYHGYRGEERAPQDGWPVFQLPDLATPVRLLLDDSESTGEGFRFNPRLDLLVWVNYGTVMFRSGSGFEPAGDRMPGTRTPVKDCVFSASGRRLVIANDQGITSVPLKLTAAEEALLNRNAVRQGPTPAHRPGTRPPVPLLECKTLDGLGPPLAGVMPPTVMRTRYAPSIVRIVDEEGAHLGTGFVIGSQGYILSACTAVPALRGWRVVVPGLKDGSGKERQLPARLLFAERKYRALALLKVECPTPLVPLRLPNHLGSQAGGEVVVIGYAMAGGELLNNTLSTGIVSGQSRRPLGPMHDVACLQLTAEVHPGMVGAPVLDVAGNVVGVALTNSDKGTVNYAVGHKEILTFLDLAERATELLRTRWSLAERQAKYEEAEKKNKRSEDLRKKAEAVFQKESEKRRSRLPQE